MQGPTGSSGVQRFPKSGHCAGVSLPVMTSPQRQAVVLAAALYVTPNFFSASYSASSSRSARPLCSIAPRPRQRSRRASKHFSIIARASGLPCGATARRYSFCTRLFPSASCLQSRYTDERISSGSKPLMTAGSA